MLSEEEQERLRALQRSHAELRAALIFAGRRISKLSINDKAIPVLRQALKEARQVAHAGKVASQAAGPS